MATVSRRRGKWVADYRDGIGRRHWETYETRRAAEDALAHHVTAVREGATSRRITSAPCERPLRVGGP